MQGTILTRFILSGLWRSLRVLAVLSKSISQIVTIGDLQIRIFLHWPDKYLDLEVKMALAYGLLYPKAQPGVKGFLRRRIVIGFAGKIININLDDYTVTKESTSEHANCNGEVGLGYDVIFYEPYSSMDCENRLLLAGNPLGKALAPDISNYEVISICPDSESPQAEQPLTELSRFDQHLGTELRCSGHDAIVIRGNAKQPIYIFINDDLVELRNARHLWGLSVYDTIQRIFKDVNDSKLKIIAIGPAKTFSSKNSAAPHKNCCHSHEAVFGRLMVSKNLKAIVVRGSRLWSQRFKAYVKI